MCWVNKIIAVLTACLFFETLVHVLNASAKAHAKTVFGQLKLDLCKTKHDSMYFLIYSFSLVSNPKRYPEG